MFVFKSRRFTCKKCGAFADGIIMSSDYRFCHQILECSQCAAIHLVKYTENGWPDPSRISQVIRRGAPVR
jgi:hypothetical protein